jgi:hypothetical protein
LFRRPAGSATAPKAKVTVAPKSHAAKRSDTNWHVIVKRNKQSPGAPLLVMDKVLRVQDFKDSKQLMRAVSQEKRKLRARYPSPKYRVLTGAGPESGTPQYASFLSWLMRE